MAIDVDNFEGVETDEDAERRRAGAPVVPRPNVAAVEPPEFAAPRPDSGMLATLRPNAAPEFAAPSVPAASGMALPPPTQPSLTTALRSTMAQEPRREDYVPPEPHGWSKVGHTLAAFQPAANYAFNVAPQRRAEAAYQAAEGKYQKDFANQLAIAREQREEEALRQRPELLEASGALKERLRTQQDEAAAKRTKDIIEGQNKREEGRETTSKDIASGREKSAEQIAKERTESNERVARGHDLAALEREKIRAANANDPNKLTNTMKTMKQQAQSTLPGIERAMDETERVAGLLGPVEGRWNDFMTGKVGAGDPTFKHYKDEIGMVQSAVTLAHARGRMSNELFEHFEKMFDAGKLTPENMMQALNVAHEWLSDYATMGETPVKRPAATNNPATANEAPKGASDEVYKDGKLIGHVVNKKYVPLPKVQ